jgi:hypothetical protein
LKIALLNSNQFVGELSADVNKLVALENFSLFDNKMRCHSPDFRKLIKLKEI